MHIFLSYPRKDKSLAIALKDVLFNGGHSIWMDDQIITGQPWREQLEIQIKRADAIALALTPNWVASPHCNWEFITAVENGKKVIPVLLTTGTPLPARISQYQYADLSGGFDAARVQKMLDDLVTLATAIDPAVIADLDKNAYAQQIDNSTNISGDQNTVTRTSSITIGGRVGGGNVNIGGSQTFHGDVSINMDTIRTGEDEHAQLQTLIDQLNAALQQIQPDDAEVIKALAQDAINEASKDQLNKRLLEIKGESLKKAAENLAVVAPRVAKIVQKLLLIG